MKRGSPSSKAPERARDAALAETSFDCLDRRGKVTPLRIAVESLRLMPREGRLSEYGRCRVAIEPLIGTLEIGGMDEFQALCLAIGVVRRSLKALVAEGWTIVSPGTNQLIDLDHPQFFPLMSADDWRKTAHRSDGEKRRRSRR